MPPITPVNAWPSQIDACRRYILLVRYAVKLILVRDEYLRLSADIVMIRSEIWYSMACCFRLTSTFYLMCIWICLISFILCVLCTLCMIFIINK